MKRSCLLVAATASAAALAIAVPPATASPPVPESPRPVVSGLVSPLQFDLGHHGQIYVGQSFAGVLTKVRRDGSTKDLLARRGSITGVASRGSSVVFTFSGGDEASPRTLLKKRSPNGSVRTIANLSRFERNHNPDGGQRYGLLGLSDECEAQLPDDAGLVPYTGIVESNPYAVANAPHGWYVADAAANAVLKVAPDGRVRVVEVLRPVRTRVTAEAAAATGMPDCVVGAVYATEPVPTDVEVTRSGRLVVSSLPGGPEDDSLGARGRVLRIGPAHTTVLARGFLGATNVALGRHGTVYVAEVFGNRVSAIRRNGHVRPVATLPSPAGVEFARGRLYASVDVFGDGSIVTVGR
jgi:hypothetical protein